MTMRNQITFREWVERRYRRGDEAISRSLARLANDHDISAPTLFYAYHGARISVPMATKIETITRGAVSLSSLVTGPKRTELKIRAGRKAAREEAAHG